VQETQPRICARRYQICCHEYEGDSFEFKIMPTQDKVGIVFDYARLDALLTDSLLTLP
jgi:hypothetical protein